MRLSFIAMLAQLLSNIAFGQSRTIDGAIWEAETQKSIGFCHITLLHSTAGTISDKEGKFMFEIPNALDHPILVISHLGYKTDTVVLSSRLNDLVITLKSSEKTLDEIVITGVSKATTIRENPASIAIVSSKAIESTIESNIIDVLSKNVPGLNAVKTGPNISKPFIRGLGYNRVLTLYDGVRQEGQQWGDEHGIEVDAYNIERAEVIKGPASLMYGSDALAGVVSIFPFTPKQKDGVVRGRFLSEYQSNNGLIGNGLALSNRGYRWHWALSGSYRLAKNYTNTIDGRVYNTGYDEKNASGLIGYTNGKGHSHLNFTLYDNLQGIPDGSRDSLTRRFTKQIDEGSSDNLKNRAILSEKELNSYALSPLHQHIQHYRIYTNNQYQLGKGDVSILLGFQQNIRKEYNHPTNPNQAGLFVRLNTLNYGIRYNSPDFSRFEISVGVNGMYQDNKNKDATDFPIPDFNLLDVGSCGFIKWSQKKWTVSGGARFDIRHISSHDFYLRQDAANGFNTQVHLPDTVNAKLQFPSLNQSFKGVSLSAGTTFQINSHLSVKANVARGYRAPNITEIASNGLDPGAHIFYVGNRNFVPEFSMQQDVGLTGSFKTVFASLSIFNNIVQNYIYLSQLVDGQGRPIELLQGNKTFQYQQASAHLYGMEATFEVRPRGITDFVASSNLSCVFGNNTKNEFQNMGVNGQYLPFIPPVKILSSISHEIKTRGKIISRLNLKADVDFNAFQSRYLALYNTETATPGYVLINVAMGTDLKYSKDLVAQFQFQINNLFDTVYQSNLSRLKYFEYYTQSPTRNLGMFGMGRNVCVKVVFPF